MDQKRRALYNTGEQEIFQVRGNKLAYGDRTSEGGEGEFRQSFVASVTAQLTDKGNLTPEGEQYCADYGVRPDVESLAKWAKLPGQKPV